MKRAPYIPFYPSDWLAGTADLTPAEAGIYITALALIYDNGGPIKADIGRLARRMNCPAGSFKAALESLCDAGKLIIRDGLLTNQRAERELEIRSQKGTSASASARVRWSKNDAKTDAAPMRSHPIRNPNQNQNHIEEEDKSSSSSGEVEDFREWWSVYPKRIGRAAAGMAYRAAIARGATPEALLADLRRAIETDRRFQDPGGRFNPDPAKWLADWEPSPPAPVVAAIGQAIEVDASALDEWPRVNAALAGRQPEAWIKRVSVQAGRVTLEARSDYAAKRIRTEWGALIQRLGLSIDSPAPVLTPPQQSRG